MGDRNHDENPSKKSDLIEITPQKRPFTTSPSNNGALSNSPIEHIRSVAKAEINEDVDTSNEVNKTVAAGKSSMVGSSMYTRSLAESNSGRKGLNNLGNTCFMNSALQCLSAAPLLTAYFLRGDWADELNSTNPLGMGGEIPKAYAKVIKNLWLSDLHMSSYAPREFKYTIGQRNPTFVGYGQQDSHELLQSLLDGLHEDLNRIRNRAYQEDPEYDPTKMTEDDFAKLSWESYKKINDSIIVDLFQGQLKSRTECQVCFRSSIKFDPYMYLQLPIPEPLTQNMIVRVFESSESIRKEVLSVIESINIPGNVITEDEITQYMDFLELTKKCLDQFRIKEISVSVPRNGSIKDLKTEIAKQLNWDSIENINCVDIFNSKIYKKFEDSESINSISPNDTIYISIFTSVKKMQYDPALSKYLPRDSMSFSLIEPSVSTVNFIELSNRISTSTEHSVLVPMFLSLPSTFYFDPPLTSQEEFGKVIGELLYRVIAEKLAPFSKIPLFRIKESNILLTDLIEADSNSPCATKISFFPLSDDWECIPNLFEISVDISDGGPVVIYPFSASSSGYPSTTSKSDVNSDHNLLASHKSDLSDLTHRMERNGSIESEPDESLDSTIPSLPQVSEEEENVAKEDFSYFSHSGDYNIRVSFAEETTKILFGVSNNTYSYRDAKYETFEPIASQSLSRQDEQMKPISLNECMAEFTKEELLDGADTIYCSKCKEHQPTKKQLSVYSLPEILVVHLKRFSNSGRISSRSKLDCFIDAPEVGLDMTSLISGRKEDVLYDLFAVSNHFGSLGGGHYTAYAKTPLDEKWYNCDDSYVSITSEKVITKAAYLLFYQRRSSKKIDFTKIVQDSNENLALEVKKKADEEEKRYQDEIERKKTLFYQAEVESASTLETNETEVESFPSSFEEKSPSRSI